MTHFTLSIRLFNTERAFLVIIEASAAPFGHEDLMKLVSFTAYFLHPAELLLTYWQLLPSQPPPPAPKRKASFYLDPDFLVVRSLT